MRPPECALCDQEYDESESLKGWDLVQFKETEEQKIRNQRFEDSDITGHPEALEWFCPKHLPFAKKYSHLYYGDALDKMRDELMG